MSAFQADTLLAKVPVQEHGLGMACQNCSQKPIPYGSGSDVHSPAVYIVGHAALLLEGRTPPHSHHIYPWSQLPQVWNHGTQSARFVGSGSSDVHWRASSELLCSSAARLGLPAAVSFGILAFESYKSPLGA